MQGACQQNKPKDEQLAAQLHQVKLVGVGRQGGKHWAEGFKKLKTKPDFLICLEENK